MKPRTNRKDFETLEEILRRFDAKGRSSSAAFVIWFLRTIYRMDDVEAEDAVCDATDDGGIDGLITDDDLKEIVLVGTVRARSLETDAEEQLWRLVQAGFRERRKMLHNVLSRQLPAVGRARVGEALAATGIASDRRPQELSVEQWIALSAAIGPLDRAGAPA